MAQQDDTGANAQTGSCRAWNDDISALKNNGTGAAFSTTFQVSAALFFIVFILSFVTFTMSALERFVGLKSFAKGLVGLIYQSVIVLVAVIATIIGGVKFQEINQFAQGSVCQYEFNCNNHAYYANLCSLTSPNGPTALTKLAPFMGWGFGLGVAVAACAISAFQLFVAFRHYAAESRAADTKGDGNAA